MVELHLLSVEFEKVVVSVFLSHVFFPPLPIYLLPPVECGTDRIRPLCCHKHSHEFQLLSGEILY